jgi:hypothetical protein
MKPCVNRFHLLKYRTSTEMYCLLFKEAAEAHISQWQKADPGNPRGLEEVKGN